MSSLSQAEIDQVIKLNRFIGGIDSVDELRSETLRRMEDMFRASCGMFLLRPPGAAIPTFDRYAVRGLPEEFPRRYSCRALIHDPFARILMSRPGMELSPEVRTGNELVSYRDLPETPFYREFMRPFDIYHMLRMELVVDGRSIATLGLFRPESKPNFSRTEHLKAMLSVSALANALDRALQKEEFRDNLSILASSASMISHVGILLLDENLDILYCDNNARHWLESTASAGGAVEGGRAVFPRQLAAFLGDVQKRLRKKGDRGKIERTLALPRHDGAEPDQVHLRAERTGGGRWRLLAYILPSERGVCPAGRLRELGLSGREAEIVQLVVAGLRNHEIAAGLSISLNTVQSHLTNIFRKLNVASRPELVVLAMSPVVGRTRIQ